MTSFSLLFIRIANENKHVMDQIMKNNSKHRLESLKKNADFILLRIIIPIKIQIFKFKKNSQFLVMTEFGFAILRLFSPVIRLTNK